MNNIIYNRLQNKIEVEIEKDNSLLGIMVICLYCPYSNFADCTNKNRKIMCSCAKASIRRSRNLSMI